MWKTQINYGVCILDAFFATLHSLSSQNLRNLQAVTEWMCQILMWCLHLLSCFASYPSNILYPSTNPHNTTFQKKVIPIASNTRVDGIKDKWLAQSWEQKFFKTVTAYMWKRKSTLSVPTSTRDFFLRNHEIKIPDLSVVHIILLMMMCSLMFVCWTFTEMIWTVPSSICPGIKCLVWCVGDRNLTESRIRRPLNGPQLYLRLGIFSIILSHGYTWH